MLLGFEFEKLLRPVLFHLLWLAFECDDVIGGWAGHISIIESGRLPYHNKKTPMSCFVEGVGEATHPCL